MAYIGKTRQPDFLYFASGETVSLAKWFRKKETKSEKMLWKHLKGKNIRGVKFRRQHPIEFYIADFYCHEARLVIELDGPIHKSQDRKLHDENRSAEMDRLGIKVIRFTNEEVNNNIATVIKAIRNQIDQRLASL
jgi:very-short-patch-repair endonuclease